MAAKSAHCEFGYHQILRLQRKSGLKGRIAATACCWQRRLWAGHVSYIAVRPRLCKARFLRIAATREHAPHDRCQPKAALTHSKATRQKAFGVYIFDCHRLGQADVSGFRLPQPTLANFRFD
jgi:hypothetical protein